MFGPRTEPTDTIQDFASMPENWTWKPCPSTVQATPWSNSGGRKTATVLCQLLTRMGEADQLDIRHTVKCLLDRLRDQHGLLLKAAFEYEFVVHEKKTLKPVGSSSNQLLDLRTTQPDLDLLCELTEMLEKAGFPVSSIQPEFSSGQWELNFPPQEGLRAADFAFHVKNAIKIFFAQKGYVASFMTFPKLGGAGNSLHLNHSLWTLDGHNAMRDEEASISRLAQHWNAGLLSHAVAMTAFCCPTVNCFRRLHLGDSYPSHITWSVENRNSLNRFKTKDGNVYLESRLSSGAANPYLILACHLAAGLSGLVQEKISPPLMDVENAQKLPRSLEEALQALENDEVLKDTLGHRFVSYYITAKKEYDICPSQRLFKSEEEKLEYEREKYLECL